jgi:hypothetical protein
MPFQNRVSPEGKVVATPARGLMYGNRGGCFHRPDRTLHERHWANRQWLCCVLQFKNRRRTLLQPGRFTELFFLDEATALAAGHRPCFECRRDAAVRFQSLWPGSRKTSAPDMDVVLHAQRLTEAGLKRVATSNLAVLPDGAFVRWLGTPHLVQSHQLHHWSFEGYTIALPRPALATVEVLTPPAIVAILQAGYQPMLHPSMSSFAGKSYS